MDIPLNIQRGLEFHRAGRMEEAEKIYRRILAHEPNQPEALHLLGLARYAVGDYIGAMQWIDRAIGIIPGSAEYHNNRGAALRGLGRNEEAIGALKRALEIDPNYAAAWLNLGSPLQQTGRSAEALEVYRRVLATQPESVESWNDVSLVLHDLGRFDEAMEAARRALSLRPNYGEAMNNLGLALRGAGRAEEAIELYRRAIGLRPDMAVLYNNLGTLLKEKSDIDGAIEAFSRAAALKPDMAEAHNNLGGALKDHGRLDEAIACFRRAVEIRPDYAAAHSNLVYTLHFHPHYDAEAIGYALRGWADRHGRFGPLQAHGNDRSTERRLRVGYVSPDFREHVVGWNLLPLLEKHDRERFEVFCYSDVRRADGMTERIRASVDQWRNILGRTHEEVEAIVRNDRIDILVDLTLHMGHNRMQLFGRKPAPVQATYLGYCGSTGLEAVDYRFSDPYLDPAGTDHLYVEKTVRLPTSYWCYRPGGETPDVPPLPDGITFACLNNFAKVSTAAMELWEMILRAVPGSKLLLHSQAGGHLAAARARFGEAVEFVGMQNWTEYIRTYGRASISLDPFPYGGGITTCDSLWMGVPVVTLAGNMPVGRAGTTLLSQIGLGELIARTPEEYVKIAADLAKDRNRLAELRTALRPTMQSSPLMDAARLAREIEAEYRRMWKMWVTR